MRESQNTTILLAGSGGAQSGFGCIYVDNPCKKFSHTSRAKIDVRVLARRIQSFSGKRKATYCALHSTLLRERAFVDPKPSPTTIPDLYDDIKLLNKLMGGEYRSPVRPLQILSDAATELQHQQSSSPSTQAMLNDALPIIFRRPTAEERAADRARAAFPFHRQQTGGSFPAGARPNPNWVTAPYDDIMF